MERSGKTEHQKYPYASFLQKVAFISIFAIFNILLFPLAASAQSDNYKYYDINKIHSNEVIKGISKDEQGFMWLATDQGVLRFDGNETTLFYKDLPSAFTKKFLKRKNGQFLVLTDYGVKEIVQSKDTTYFQDLQLNGAPFTQPLTYPKSIFEDREGNIWIGESSAVVKISEEGFKRYPLGAAYNSISYHRSFSFAEDAFGNLWIAPFQGRLLVYNKQQDVLEDVNIPYPVTDVTSMVVVQGDYLLIGGKEGLLRLKIDSNKAILANEFIGGPENISTAFVLGNEVYVGTWENGLFYSRIDENMPDFSKVEDLPFSDILDLYYDEGYEEIWLAGSENIGLLKPTLISPIGQVGKYRAEALTLDGSGNFYYSTGSQIFSIKPEQEDAPVQIYASKTTYFDRILAEDDQLWIGDAFGGISYYDLSRNSVHHLRDSAGTGSPVTYILRDRNDNKWFAGLPELVKVSATDEIKGYKEVNNAVVIKESAGGQLYCGGQGKDSLLYIFDASRDDFSVQKLDFNFEPSAGIRVEDIDFDSLGNPWLATTEGLLKVKKNNGGYEAERITLKGIDINESLKSIAIVNDKIWLASSRALVLYQPDETISYTRENGLPSRVLKERSFLVHDNALYVATAKGLARIDLQNQLLRSTARPLFKAVMVNGEKQILAEEGEKVVFPYGSRVQVDFVSLSYPGYNILYQTRVEGLEESWSEPTPNSSFSVLGFPEGRYTLQIRARDTGYLWSEPLQFSFVVATPWFKSWWAFLVFLLLAVLLIFISVRVYHFHLIRQKVKLQAIIEERTKEINAQKNEIIEQKNKLIRQKEELIEKNNAVFQSQQALSEADLNYLHLKEKQLQDQIEYRNKQITTHTLNIIQKNEMLKDLRDELESIIKTPDGVSHNQLRKMQKLIDESFRLDKDWEEFKLYFEQIYTGFYAKLKINYPDLTNQELRHCALIRLNLSNAECASILGISPNSVKVTRTRLRKKLNLQNHSLTDFVMGI